MRRDPLSLALALIALAALTAACSRTAWRVAHHAIAHPLIGLTGGALWAWRLHDWSGKWAWPGTWADDPPERWRGLE